MRRAPWPRVEVSLAPEDALVCLADAHLTAEATGPRAEFCRFARSQAGNTLVLLGDLFHLFPGPDAARRPEWRELLDCLRGCARRGKVYFLPGNRDFHAGRVLAAAAGVLVPGEAARFRSGDLRVYACHGDQLCQDDVWYQRMKALIRNPLPVALWMQLPAACRSGIARVLRAWTLRSLRRKPARQLRPSPEVVRRLCARGADVIVSGHRHAEGRAVFDSGGRTCVHYELPAWSDERTFVRVRAGTAEFVRLGS
ncbi:MAG TPA: hypothetical protein PKX48_02120 [Planctomycetota bacterium]|nr:hypothetical protein [Planctomycetota bacterium]HNR98568.1 hypothetical protein [Planctomycetota bacterium]HNU26113.1 hypothetical protein [Planctomycetota bacterium]HOE28792.1 hypothetical protein [Planctomycetota bacterium]HOE85449.1 hypothetical protein [Planctomycetota bacterium]